MLQTAAITDGMARYARAVVKTIQFPINTPARTWIGAARLQYPRRMWASEDEHMWHNLCTCCACFSREHFC